MARLNSSFVGATPCVALVCMFLAVYVEPVLALPSTLRVQLFEMRENLNRVQLTGPFEIISPIHRKFTAESVVIRTKGSQIAASELRVGANPRRSHGGETASRPAFFKGDRLVIASRSPRGIRLGAGANLERRYTGSLTFSNESGNLRVLNEVPVPQYLASVVGSEAPTNCPPEALKSIALLALMIVESKKDGEIVGDSTKEQAYKGAQYITSRTQAAASAVMDKRLLFNGSPIQAYYHSTCAGGTSSGADIFGPAAAGLDYLSPVKCTYCRSSPFWKEKVSFIPLSKFKSILGTDELPVVSKYDKSGRPVMLNAKNSSQSGYEAWIKIGRALGWGVVPGTRYKYVVIAKAGQDSVRITSSGAGHGVGLCQWGALDLAGQGRSMEKILAFYFPGSKLVSIKRK